MTGSTSFTIVHVTAGTVALITFWLSALLRKGSERHRLSGRVYLVAMALVIASGVPLTLERLSAGQVAGAAFLGYLLLLVSTSVWLSWRAIRDRAQPERYLGPAYHALSVVNPLAGVAVLYLGLTRGQPLLAGFSLVGIFTGLDMLRRRRIIPTLPRWWLQEHYGAMVANAAATHIAFLSIGLPRLLPVLQGPAWFYLAWFGPVLLAVAARLWPDRRYRAVAPPHGSRIAHAWPPSLSGTRARRATQVVANATNQGVRCRECRFWPKPARDAVLRP